MAYSSYSQSNKRPAEIEAERKDDSEEHTFTTIADINPRKDFQRLRDYCSLNSIWFEERTDAVQWKSDLLVWCGNHLKLRYGVNLHNAAHITQTHHMSIREYYIPLLIMVLHWHKLPNWTSLTPECLFDDSANGEPRLPVAWSLYVADTSVSAQHTTQFNYYRSGYDRYVQITIKNLSESVSVDFSLGFNEKLPGSFPIIKIRRNNGYNLITPNDYAGFDMRVQRLPMYARFLSDIPGPIAEFHDLVKRISAYASKADQNMVSHILDSIKPSRDFRKQFPSLQIIALSQFLQNVIKKNKNKASLQVDAPWICADPAVKVVLRSKEVSPDELRIVAKAVLNETENYSDPNIVLVADDIETAFRKKQEAVRRQAQRVSVHHTVMSLKVMGLIGVISGIIKENPEFFDNEFFEKAIAEDPDHRDTDVRYIYEYI